MNERRTVGVTMTVLALTLTVIACNGSSPANNQPATSAAPAATTPVAAPDLLETMTSAPGSDRFAADEHPEQADLSSLTVDSLTTSIANYVADESKRRGGMFPVPNPETGAPMNLALSKVHKERLSKLADGRYFACADFKSEAGDTYDVDIFMRPHSTSGVVPTDIIVHKVNGTARFNWSERDGVWTATPVTLR